MDELPLPVAALLLQQLVLLQLLLVLVLPWVPVRPPGPLRLVSAALEPLQRV